ncbi:3-oxoacyl-[acyl-carrier-protein] synthase III C-terminal domain-containing protein [Variovorax sp. GB1P17]|uniref:3-oxoacyl-[acyl-carrier-protein] synthase III C-terminal domain-containing protein n=1 Tax=Variovorax sp. GB1P17 TaxID=3443740 RepID=UPI003F44CD8F
MSELAKAAIRSCLTSVPMEAAEIDAVFLVSCTLDAQNNLQPVWLGELAECSGLQQVPHYHIGITGCAGFHWATRLASAMVASGNSDRVLVVMFDKATSPLQRLYGEGTAFMYVTGDAAAACIVSASSSGMDYRLLGQVINLHDSNQIAVPSMDAEIYKISELFTAAYAQAGRSARDIDHFISNNYSLEVSRLYCQLAEVDFRKAVTSPIGTHAHCFSADNLIGLRQLADGKELNAGNTVLCFSAGPHQWGACLLEKLGPTSEMT